MVPLGAGPGKAFGGAQEPLYVPLRFMTVRAEAPRPTYVRAAGAMEGSVTGVP